MSIIEGIISRGRLEMYKGFIKKHIDEIVLKEGMNINKYKFMVVHAKLYKMYRLMKESNIIDLDKMNRRTLNKIELTQFIDLGLIECFEGKPFLNNKIIESKEFKNIYDNVEIPWDKDYFIKEIDELCG